MRPTTLIFHCPACGSRLQLPASMQGVVGPCPKCKTMIRAPSICTEIPRKPNPRTGNAKKARKPNEPEKKIPAQRATKPVPKPGEEKQIPPLPTRRETERRTFERTVFAQPRGISRDRKDGPRIAPVRKIEPAGKTEGAGQTAAEQPKPRREQPYRWLLVFGACLALLLSGATILIFVLFLLKPRMKNRGGEHNTPGKHPAASWSASPRPDETPKATGSAAPPPPENNQGVVTAAQAEESLDRFLLSDSLEARLPVMISRRSPEELARTSLAGALPTPVTPMLENRIDTPKEGLVEFFFRVEFPDAAPPAPQLLTLAVRQRGESSEPPKVLADAFLDLFDGGLVAFANAPQDGTRSFHVFLEAIPTCEDLGIPEPEKKITMRLRPNPKAVELADTYVGRNSMVAQMLEPPRPSLRWGKPSPCIVSLRWNRDVPDKPFLELVKIDSFTWTR